MLTLPPWASSSGHRDQDDRRRSRRARARCRTRPQVEVLVGVLDAQRRRLRLAFDVARDDRDRAVLAEAACGRQDDAVDDRPADRRQRDPPERLPTTPAPSVCAACSCSSPISRSVGTTSRATNGSETKIVAITIDGSAKRIWTPCSLEPVAEPAGAAVEQEERQADDDRRERERQVDDRVDDPGAAGSGGARSRARTRCRRPCSAAPRSRRCSSVSLNACTVFGSVSESQRCPAPWSNAR